MISVSFDAKSFKGFMKDLKQSTTKLQPAFNDFGKYMMTETKEQFETETDPDGKAWEPLKPATLRIKKTNTKLRETLEMYNSMYYKATNEYFIFGIKDIKYQFHHFGTSRMAQRRVVGITNERRKKLNGFVVAQIRRVKGLRNQRRKK